MINVAHIDEFFEMTDQKLKFEQSVAISNIKYLVENPCHGYDIDLEMAIDQCKKYTEAIKKRYANIEHQVNLRQLDLFCP